MRHLITGFCNVLCLSAVACVWTLAPAMAKEPASSDALPTSERSSAHAEQAMIPACLEGLQLSGQQQGKIREVVALHDAKLTKVWEHFRNQYRETIGVESSLLAAIEDNLSDAQRMELRSQRRKIAMDEKAMQEKNGQLNQATTTKPESAVEEASAAGGVSLTTEQQATADKLQEKYLTRLRSLNRDIQGLHTRLVSLEADKLVEIEKVLTPEQLKQLREVRKNAPLAGKISAKGNTPVKSE